ncbi:sensor histidine kinase [Arcicella rigui]|uniref:histidine kinase n=1 Tax=Arcicella rigui TaxID=797020 RepID=A0ABU5QAK2_9BACT|nr:PAS domain-containing sensor histidine kinase [Arcicella rigui]MEA5139874.1 PAS domain-containing sensor histidine kinase [Arcicella rigui]
MNESTLFINLNSPLLDVFDECVFAINHNFEFLGFNKAFAEQYKTFFGCYPTLFKKGMGAGDFFIGEKVRAAYQKAFLGEPFEMTETINKKSISIFFKPVLNEKSEVDFVIIYTKSAEAKPRLSETVSVNEQRYQYMIDNFNEVMFQTDLEGNWIFLNKAWTNILEYSIEESIGKNYTSFIHPDDIAPVLSSFDPVMKGEKENLISTVRYISKSGKIKWLKVLSNLIYNDQKEVIGISGTMTDVSIEKEKTNINNLLSQNIKDLVCIHNMDGTYLYVSPSIEDLTGFKPEELLGKSPYEFFHPEDIEYINNDHEEVIKQKTSVHYLTYRFKKKCGDYVWVESNTKVFYDDFNLENRLITSTREIQERKLAEEGLMKALHRERELNELKSRFVSMTTHELKTPLSVISSSAEIIEVYTQQIDNPRIKNISKQLDNIYSEIIRITKLINDTLLLGKIEMGSREIKKVEINLLHLVQYIIERQNRQQKDNRVIEFEKYGIERNIQGDTLHFEHILDNLISNAFKYSQNRPNPKLILTFNESDFQVVVIDSGIGIPLNQQKMICTSFFRGHNVGNIKGSGLGLFLVNNLVKIYQGEISFESAEDHGTTFRLRIPYEIK